MTVRRGRRAGESGTKASILDAARATFADHGYDGTTLREIARRARVDPALVHHFFGTKDRLFAAAMTLPIDPGIIVPALLAGGIEGLGGRMVRLLLGLWDEPATRQPLVAILRTAMSSDRGAAQLRGFLSANVIGPVVAALPLPDRELRAELIGSQLLGLALVRTVVKLEPLASTDAETVIALVGPVIQRYIEVADAPSVEPGR